MASLRGAVMYDRYKMVLIARRGVHSAESERFSGINVDALLAVKVL